MPNNVKDGTSFTETDDDEAEESHVAPWRALFAFTTKKHLTVLALAIIFSFISAANIPAKAYLLGKTFNVFTTYGAGTITATELKEHVGKYCTYLAIVGLVNWATSAAFFMCWLVFAELQAKTARDEVFEGLLGKEMEWYDTRPNGISATIPRLQAQIRELQTALAAPIGDLVQFTVVFFSCLGLAFYYGWSLTLVTIAGVPIIFVGVRLISRRMHAAIDAQQDAMTKANKHVTTAVSSIDVVKYFNGKAEEVARFGAAIKVAATHYVRQAHWNALQQGVVILLTRSMFVQGFWYGSTLIDAGKRNPGQVLTTFWAALQGVGALQSILPQLMVLEKGRAAGARLKEMVATSRTKALPVSRAIDNVRSLVKYEDVSFAYPTRPDVRVLDNMNLSFPSGEIMYVVGKSGSGKSTIGQLLARFYDPVTGSITLDGVPISKIDTRSLRENVMLLEQQNTLFNTTLRENLALAAKDGRLVPRFEVEEAIDFALLRPMVGSMARGIETVIASRGSSLSGGQRQRMALARAKIRDPPILVLDEPTSALDPVTRDSVMERIRKWRTDKTTLIITHDTAQIQPLEFVVVLKDGKIVQRGIRKDIEAAERSTLNMLLAEGDKSRNDYVSPLKPAEDGEPSRNSPHLSSQNAMNKLPRRSSSVYSRDDTSNEDFVHYSRQNQQFHSPTVSPRPPSVVWSPYGMAARMSFSPSFSRPPSALLRSPDKQSLSPLLDQKDGRPPKPPPKDTPPRHATPRRAPKERPVALVEYQEAGLGLGITTDEPATSDKASSFLSRDTTAVASIEAISEGEEEIKPTKTWSVQQILRTVLPSLGWWPRLVMSLGFAGAGIHAVAIPIFSWLFSKLVSTFFASSDRKRRATIYSLGILGVAFGDGFGSYIMHMFLEYCGQCWVDSVRTEALTRILSQPKDFFTRQEHSVSRLAEALDRNAEEMRYLLSRFTGLIFVATLMMGTSITWAFIDAWQVTFVGLASAPYVYAVSKAYSAISAKWESASNDAGEAAAAIFTETFTSIRTVQCLTLENHFRRKHLDATQRALKVGLQKSFYCGFFFGLTESSIEFVTALVFYYGAVLASHGNASVSNIIGAFSQLLFSIGNVSGILSFIPQMSSSLDTATRLLRLANLPVGTSHEDTGGVRISTIGDIEFRACNFSYPSRPNHLVLSNLTLLLRRNRTTALVGASGSGKSTIASLILGLYPPNPFSLSQNLANPFSAPLTISGRPITRLDISTLRSLIAVVPQTPLLFPTTLFDNIIYGLPPSSPLSSLTPVKRAAQLAGIGTWIDSLPSGYATIVGENGAGISGGQAQRIAIARALVREPQCLVLDECTSALDPESSRAVRETLRKVVEEKRRNGEGITVLVITHEVEMMRECEEVVVLQEGRVVQRGGFEEVRRRGGPLRDLLEGERRGS
ncbi:MAG: hypothetical protein M1820_006208 [Bogoriella megaspora]|nr:MAG: hypothetical protein M1820_006208 [Bogoriella megaspora]